MQRNNGFLVFLFIAVGMLFAGVVYGVGGNPGAMRTLMEASIFPMGAAALCVATATIDHWQRHRNDPRCLG